MSADTVSAPARNVRTAALLLEVAAGLAATATALTTTGEDLAAPQEVLGFAADLLELGNPDPALDHSDQGDDGLGELEQTRLEMAHTRRFAVDAHELLDQAATQLTNLQAQAWDYDRAAWLQRVRPLLAANPYDPAGHLPDRQPPRLIEADRLRVAAFTIQAADVLHAAVRTGNPALNPALLTHAVEVYEHARRLYAQAIAASTVAALDEAGRTR